MIEMRWLVKPTKMVDNDGNHGEDWTRTSRTLQYRVVSPDQIHLDDWENKPGWTKWKDVPEEQE